MGLISLYLLVMCFALTPFDVHAAPRPTLLVFDLEENIVQPLRVSVTRMTFPNLIEGQYEGDLSSDSTINGNTGSNAVLSIAGEPWETFRISGLESGIILAGGISGFINVALSPSSDCNLVDNVGTLLGDDGCNLTIRGTATIAHGQAAGYYSGQQTIMVGYY